MLHELGLDRSLHCGHCYLSPYSRVKGLDLLSECLGGLEITYPAWCRVAVRRRLPTGEIGVFYGKELWKENYATAKKDSAAPNSMWARRPYAQLAKCAQAQALRQAFPEMCSAPTAEEMEGKEHTIRDVTPRPRGVTADPFPKLAAPAVRPWQDFYPHGWGDEEDDDDVTYGEIADGPNGDNAMRARWRDDRNNPALVAWAASWIMREIPYIADLDWTGVKDSVPGILGEITDLNAEQMRTVAAYVAKARAAQDKADAERGDAE